MAKTLISDNGITKTYRITNAQGKVIGTDEEPSVPIVDPNNELSSAITAATDIATLKAALLGQTGKAGVIQARSK